MDSISPVAVFIRSRIAVVGNSAEFIAQHLGLESPDMVAQIKNGQTPLPLEKVGAMAKVLRTDPFGLWAMCMEEYQPDTWKAISPFMEVGLTSEERRLLNNLRFVAGGPYLASLDEESKSLFDQFIASIRCHKTIQ